MKSVQIKTGHGLLTLDLQALQWKPEGDDLLLRADAAWANSLTLAIGYSPADGQPGYYLATRIAKEIGGEALLPPVPEPPEGAIF